MRAYTVPCDDVTGCDVPPLILPAPSADLLGSPVHPAGRYRTLGQEESFPPAPGAETCPELPTHGALSQFGLVGTVHSIDFRTPPRAGLIDFSDERISSRMLVCATGCLYGTPYCKRSR